MKIAFSAILLYAVSLSVPAYADQIISHHLKVGITKAIALEQGSQLVHIALSNPHTFSVEKAFGGIGSYYPVVLVSAKAPGSCSEMMLFTDRETQRHELCTVK